jgi:hypothetical protein
MTDHKTHVFRTYKLKKVGKRWFALYAYTDPGTFQKTQPDYRNDNVKSLEAEHRAGNGPKMGQSSTEDEEELLDAE